MQVPIERYLVHLDDSSWGIFQFPLLMADVSPNPHREQTPPTLGEFRSARDSNDGIRLYGPPFALTKDTRPTYAETPVQSWWRVGRTAAPVICFEALPSYWLSRFRYVGPAKHLRTAVTPSFDLNSFFERRQPQRNSLAHHAISLKQKSWAIRYHRGNLLAAMDRIRESSSPIYDLTIASAEYAAFGHCLYSLLEELADVLALLRTIQGLQPTPSSFHDLHSGASRIGGELGEILASATWFEPFRLERANAAHAFGTVVELDTKSSELKLWQRENPRIFADKCTQEPIRRDALAHVMSLLEGSDLLVERLCCYMLKMFHPWDLVTFMHADPGSPEVPRSVLVWVREISFSIAPGDHTTSWALLDKDGTLRVATDQRGGLITPRQRDPQA